MMQELIKQVKKGRFVLLPITDETRGHGTHSLPAIWGGELVKFLAEPVESDFRSADSDKSADPPLRIIALPTATESRAQGRSRAPPHVRHHFPPGRRQDHADRETAAVRRRDRAGRRGARPQDRSACRLRLDGHRARARHLGHLGRGRVRSRRASPDAARHAGPQGLQRRHLPHAVRGRRRRDGDRRRQGHRVADPQAVRGLQAAPPAGADLHQQARPAEPRSVRPARRDRARARHSRGADELADRQRRSLPRRLRSAERHRPLLRAQGARAPGAGATSARPTIRSSRSCWARSLEAPGRRDLAGHRRGHDVRSPGLSRLPPHAGVLRQRAVELRPRAVSPRA